MLESSQNIPTEKSFGVVEIKSLLVSVVILFSSVDILNINRNN